VLSGIYIIKPNGNCFFSYIIEKGEHKQDPDMMAPFFIALCGFINVEFGSTLKEMIFLDLDSRERHVYFQDFSFKNGSLRYYIVIIYQKGASLVDIKSNIIKLKWEIESKWLDHMNQPAISRQASEAIFEKVKGWMD